MITTLFSDAEKGPEFNQAISDFVSSGIFGCAGKFEKFCSLAVLDKSAVIAGVLYHHYDPDNGVMEMSAASLDKRWLTRPVLRQMFAVPFDVFKCQIAVLRVSEHNKPMLRIAKAYGFNEYIIPRLRGRGEAEHVLTLTDDDWRSNRFNRGKM